MNIPKAGDKVVRTAPSPVMGVGRVYKVSKVHTHYDGRTFIAVGKVKTRAEIFWERYKPYKLNLENK